MVDSIFHILERAGLIIDDSLIGAQMAQRHLNNQQQRQAMQLFHQAMRAAPDQPVYQQQLAQLMQQAGLHSYRGFRLPTAG